MDKETLTNHISKLGKCYFEIACKIVLRDIFNLAAINVDGQYDGGTDYASLDDFGRRTPVAYQITTQKSDIRRKAYKDAEKAIKKLNVERYYFLTTYMLSETDIRLIESEISNNLKIHGICFDPSTIASLLLKENLLSKFLEEANYPLPNNMLRPTLNYCEMALHSYTLLSSDSRDLKENIYDDTILFILSNKTSLSQEEITHEAGKFLSLPEDKKDILINRIGALFSKQKIRWYDEEKIGLNDTSKSEIASRKKIYEIELSNLIAAQTDILREYNVEWDIEDSRKISVWIAEAFIFDQISMLKEVKASIISHPVFENLNKKGVEKIKKYFLKKSLREEDVNKVITSILDIASTHPLITKLSRASMYLALQGANPITSAKALGASRWSDFNILVETTIAIPILCSNFYSGYVNKKFDSAIRATKRALKFDARLYIPYFYINECAGHLLQARKYIGLDLNEKELQFSSNFFVSNYYSLKNQGIHVPNSFIEYLSTFSSAIKTEKSDTKTWIRELMTDVQSILNRLNIQFINVPFYNHDDCKIIEELYSYCLHESNIKKKTHLINHDVWALQYIKDSIIEKAEHWIMLTYDNSLISFSQSENFKGWITNPIKFLSITETSKSLPDTKLVNLLHTVASFSERTLAAGARILDKIVMYASKEMQNWEFKQEIDSFKEELVKSLDYSTNYDNEIIQKTEEFLKEHGIVINIDSEEIVDD